MNYFDQMQRRQCRGKIPWPSWREARRALRRSAAFYHEPKHFWNAYRCPWCRSLHVGHRLGLNS